MAQMVKNLPVMQETQVPTLGQENPLEQDGYPFQYYCLENIPGREEPGRLLSVGLQRTGRDRATNAFTAYSPSVTMSVSLILFYK